MPITDHIKQVAERTIGLIQDYYKRNPNEGFQEQEARISRVERAMEACNGFEPDEKLQKVTENVFEMTCSWEIGTDAIKDKINLLEDKMDQIQRESLEADEKLSESFKQENYKTRQVVEGISGSVDGLNGAVSGLNETVKKIQESLDAKPREKSWYGQIIDLIRDAKWAIVVLVLVIIGGMVFNPQIISLFNALVEKIK